MTKSKERKDFDRTFKLISKVVERNKKNDMQKMLRFLKRLTPLELGWLVKILGL